MKYTRLGDLLVDAGVITNDQLMAALKGQKEKKMRLGEYLIAEGIITERQLIDALMMQLGIDFIDLSSADIDPEMTKYVSKNLAKKFGVVPVRTRGDELYLAMSDPLNFIAQEEVRTASHRQVIPMIATRSGIDHAISALYGTEGARRAIREMQAEASRDVAAQQASNAQMRTSEVGAEDANSAPSIRLVDNIIERGITDRASDIHIEPMETQVLVRMRIDGILHEEFEIPKELPASLTSRVKIMCGMDVTERRIPQDGRAIVRVRMKEVDLRVSTLPTVHGEKIVMRLLDRSKKLSTAEDLGFYGGNLEKYHELATNGQGIVLVVGPTGSGKSSTLFTMIEKLNTEEVNIVTLEDPVEYNVAGVNQVQVNEAVGMTFEAGLRSILRQDPDIVMVGEIRDGETANIALRAAVTGHMVLSTLHTNDAVSTLDRLLDIGVEPFMMSTALRGIISQRLMRRICPYCREEYDPTDEELEDLGYNPSTARAAGMKLFHGRGCPECFGSGYMGRTVVAEVLMVDRKVAQAIHLGVSRSELMDSIVQAGFEPLIKNARELVVNGVSTVEELLRVAYDAD